MKFDVSNIKCKHCGDNVMTCLYNKGCVISEFIFTNGIITIKDIIIPRQAIYLYVISELTLEAQNQFHFTYRDLFLFAYSLSDFFNDENCMNHISKVLKDEYPPLEDDIGVICFFSTDDVNDDNDKPSSIKGYIKFIREYTRKSITKLANPCKCCIERCISQPFLSFLLIIVKIAKIVIEKFPLYFTDKDPAAFKNVLTIESRAIVQKSLDGIKLLEYCDECQEQQLVNRFNKNTSLKKE